jgi:DNA-binding XRE family transcriptional regulator
MRLLLASGNGSKAEQCSFELSAATRSHQDLYEYRVVTWAVSGENGTVYVFCESGPQSDSGSAWPRRSSHTTGTHLRRMDKGRQEEVKKAFGARLRALRKALKLSQEKVALRCGLDRSYLGQIERGESNVSLVNIHRIAEALEVEAGELFSREGGRGRAND